MNEHQRIQALLQAGKITPDEAKLLLEALDTEDEVEGIEGQLRSNPEPKYAQANASDPKYAQASASEPKYAQTSNGHTFDLRWLKVRMLAGNIEASVDPSLQTPQVTRGNADMRSVGQDVELDVQAVRSDFLGGLLGSIRAGDIELKLPQGWGLEIDGKAGEVEVKDVACLRGRVLAGNIELERVHGLDLSVRAGNVEGSLLITEGQHHLKVSMGNAELKLLPGSNVKVTPHVSLGNVSNQDPVVGEGKAVLDVTVSMGNVELRAQ
jgi:hypothetical protein